MAGSTRNSVETILPSNKDDDNLSDWSVVWSTTHVPGMGTATGGGRTQRRQSGRRALRFAAFSMGGLLCMHCRVVASALTSGIFVFLLLLVPTMLVVGNPIRHFEVYLGEWGISGPGRVFRVIPSLDGLGMAICIHAVFRAITSVGIAAVAGIYVVSAINDEKLPLYWCRDFNTRYYEPTIMYVNINKTKYRSLEELSEREIPMTTGAPHDLSWQRASRRSNDHIIVEAMHYRSKATMTHINVKHLGVMMTLYACIWFFMILEKIKHKRLIWNNIYTWICFVPWFWACIVIFMGCFALFTRHKGLRNVLKIGGSKEVMMSIADAFEVAMYIHASSLGSEMIHGKGLNYYASGHIDPFLNNEALWHTALLLILTAVISGGAATCALTDYMQMQGVNRAHESALWVFPMYAKCAAGVTKYTHFVSTLIFSGLCFAYTAVAYWCLKTALHTIFEYKVKLVFIEQYIVFAVILFCAGISVLFSTDGGLALLEAFDGILAGLVTPMLCSLELIALMFVYRSRDFISDMNVATEDNSCSTRVGIQWQIAPFLCLAVFIAKCVQVCDSEIPGAFLGGALSILFLIIAVIPLRAAYNAYIFLHPPGKA